MSAIDVLRQIKLARRAEGGDGSQKVIEWGNAEYITSVGIDNMNRRELKNHLEARDLETTGTRLELIERLRNSTTDEQMNKFAYAETIDTEFMLQADLEQRGSVYVVGCNEKGQLGIGDTEPRNQFTVIKSLRGCNICFLAAGPTGHDCVFAVSEEHDVYVWGGGGVAKTGINYKPSAVDEMIEEVNAKKIVATSNVRDEIKGDGNILDIGAAKKANWMEPQLVKDFTGEEIVGVSIGLSHVMAVGKGGDCFVWGDGDAGQLGLGSLYHSPTIAINNSFPGVRIVSTGANHSAVLVDSTNGVYIWGHGGNGRLGIGAWEKVGVPDNQKHFFPVPSYLTTLEPVRFVSCGADHTLAYGASGVWAWGSGSGGKLGLGDEKDRNSPCIVPRLKGRSITSLIASTWHSMALAKHPPFLDGGWIYTWGSGYHGQLGQSTRQISLLPETIEYFITYHLSIKQIFSGSHHCAALTIDGEMYSWGSNKNGCLGRKADLGGTNFTAIPGHVGGFGALVSNIGRGFPRHVALGKEFTVVATAPYEGPDLEVATRLMEEQKLREQEIMLTAGTGMNFNEESVA